MKDSFSDFHPLVSFAYFAAVLLFSMFLMNPVFIVISLVCAVAYSVYQSGRKFVRFSLLILMPMLLLIMAVNSAFNHKGGTILCYLPGGNPLTFESVAYGAAAAGLTAAVIMWFSCFNRVVTSDKFIYLFGRIIPSLSLTLSMTVRFVPRFKAEFNRVRAARRSIGKDVTDGSLISRLKNLTAIFSVMLTWSLENSIETADSMKSRGYGLKGRTSYSLFRFERRDAVILAVIGLLSAYTLLGIISGDAQFRFYPLIYFSPLKFFSVSVYCSYFLLSAVPMIINITEDLKWKYSRSDI